MDYSIKLSARRTYFLLRKAFFQLLTEMPYEKITLTELCHSSMVPRSTFYRYFEDKYDLLCYCLQTYFDDIGLSEDIIYIRDIEHMKTLLTQIFLVFEQNKTSFQKIYVNNKNGIFTETLRSFFIQFLTQKLNSTKDKNPPLKLSSPIFIYLLADFYLGISVCYLELGENYSVEEFVDNVCLFANKEFFI
ncbi:MAG: TetR/AcrR family transcriptional regulator C-terminal domain-containing protein [bacterium]|nr:TetR/AcrR family transcriptional regulator C-terminal domain-containing protein [bacterium]